jgi:hypothetical protein
VSDSPFRYYRRLIDPTTGQKTSGQIIYIVLVHAHLQTKKIEADMGKVRPYVEGWRARLRLDDEGVRHLTWAVAIMRATKHMDRRSSHPEVTELERIGSAHLRVDAAVTALRQDLSLLIDFHQSHGSPATGMFKQLRAAVNKYDKARLPTWGPTPRLGKSWHRDAVYLFDILRAAAGRRGRSLGYLTQPDQPAVKFIHEALRHDGEAVVSALRKYGESLKVC